MKAGQRTRLAAVTLCVGLIALALIVPGTAGATQGSPVIAGQSNDATDPTYIDNTDTSGLENGLEVTAVNVAVTGSGATGLRGTGTLWGVAGVGVVGVRGQGNGNNNIGVEGLAAGESNNNLEGIGVKGGGSFQETGVLGIGGEQGVWGQSGEPTGSIAVRATGGSNGVAFHAEGRAKFSRSGKVVIPAGSAKATRYLSSLQHFDYQIHPSTLVLATIQQNRPGVFVQAAVPHIDPDGGWVTIYLNKPVTVNTTVAWFLVN